MILKLFKLLTKQILSWDISPSSCAAIVSRWSPMVRYSLRYVLAPIAAACTLILLKTWRLSLTADIVPKDIKFTNEASDSRFSVLENNVFQRSLVDNVTGEETVELLASVASSWIGITLPVVGTAHDMVYKLIEFLQKDRGGLWAETENKSHAPFQDEAEKKMFSELNTKWDNIEKLLTDAIKNESK